MKFSKNKIKFESLERAVNRIRRELYDFGILSKKVDEVDVYLLSILTGTFYAIFKDRVIAPRVMGYYNNKKSIYIPKYCFSRCSISDVLRHEYAHAIVDAHRRPFASRVFSDAFGVRCGADKSDMQVSERCISEYATTNAEEDFAETFMYYLKWRGKLKNAAANNVYVIKKWNAVGEIIKTLQKYK